MNAPDGQVLQCDLEQARDEGHRYYWSGEPCKRGHRTWRLTVCRSCYACHLAKERENRANGRDTKSIRRGRRAA
jgi:hypothetical protein